MFKQIPGGTYEIGTNSDVGYVLDNEGPVMTVEVPTFEILDTTVTNEMFKNFVEETGYVTDAEKEGSSFVYYQFLDEQTKEDSTPVPMQQWWYEVKGADWCHPQGPKSTLEGKWQHPVVHVSRRDAIAYCQWSGTRLPDEAEWEVAAKGGKKTDLYPWKDENPATVTEHCNTGQWESLQHEDTNIKGTVEVKSYCQNGYGLYQMLGNVWEWCSNPARIDLDNFKSKTPQDFWQEVDKDSNRTYAIRGGSYLCAESFCNRCRIAGREGEAGLSASGNLGFRVVKDV